MAIGGRGDSLARPAAQLKGYRAKRDFSATPEPSAAAAADPTAAPAAGGDSAARPHPPRFVIHEHDASRLHWDLRLERDGGLASWAIPKGLPEAPGDNRFAAHTEDHPLEYLDFEGEIPKGQYGAGTIWIWDRGTYECLKWEPRKVEVALHGRRVDARYALFPIDPGEEPKDWMVHRMDPPADPHREPMPERIVPMLARSGQLPPDDPGWAYEIKWDGVRAVAYSQPGELRLESRNLNDITDSYPELARLGRALGSHSAVLDGEIVAFDARGRPSFAALAQRMHVSSRAQAKRLAAGMPVTYVIFDLLYLDGHSVMGLRYEQRRELLAALHLDGERWQTPEHLVGEGSALLAASAEQGLEGILAKRLDSTYEPGLRSGAWVKVKRVGRQELVVGGWMPGKGKRKDTIGALLLGVYEPDGTLRYVGRVGSGFTERELARLAGLLAPLQRPSSPFTAGERPPRGAVFCQPHLVVEVEFARWTDRGSLRAPVYKGMREDKRPEEVVREGTTPQAPRTTARDRPPAERSEALSIHEKNAKDAHTTVDGRELALSNLAKPMYPRAGFTKRELIEYYAAIAPVLLPHLHGRPLTVTRWPDGVDGKSFFQKHAPAHRPDWVRTATIPARGKPIDYTLANDLPTLVWLANLAAIELHTPLARADAVQRPTTLVFDLDPGPPAGILECCHVAVQLHGMFENLGLHSFAKTSGSKGLQVYIPVNRHDVTFEHTKTFAKAVAELLQDAEGDLVVSRMTKSQRRGKVLIDWSQNDPNKTTVCVYSLRASAQPSVSTPVAWEEVRAALESGDASALGFEADDVLARVAERGDLFAPVLSLVQALPGF
jgi:bifunctional non-homologous end joining protein LigD